MEVIIKGGSATQRKYAESITYFVCKKLMPRMKNIVINIHIKNFGKDDTLGYCLPDDCADEQRPREFNIEINKSTRLRRMLETVAHELVHAKQFARGELYWSCVKGQNRWQGEWLSNTKKAVKDYWDNPWEIEAHGRECGLFVRWAQQEKLSSRKWAKDLN
jgi:hypothetical protein|tara:strand:+ start:857 stop:1339 length:483 start_codon:yes stop_codon:yes gene_type:complete